MELLLILLTNWRCLLSLDNSKNVAIRNTFDNGNGGGLFQSQIVSTTGPIRAVDAADVVVIEDLSLLQYYDILATAKPDASILYINQKSLTKEELIEKLPIEFKKDLAKTTTNCMLLTFQLLKNWMKLIVPPKDFLVNF